MNKFTLSLAILALIGNSQALNLKCKAKTYTKSRWGWDDSGTTTGTTTEETVPTQTTETESTLAPSKAFQRRRAGKARKTTECCDVPYHVMKQSNY